MFKHLFDFKNEQVSEMAFCPQCRIEVRKAKYKIQ
jgi:hypothetical protein